MIMLAASLPLQAQPWEPQAPPTPPPIQVRSAQATPRTWHNPPPGASLWSIGEPTDEEQLYLEYINRARTNPAAEAVQLASTTDPDVRSAYTFFGVDLNRMQSDLAALAPAPPLAMSAELLQAARQHSWDMATNGFQGHTGSDGSTPGDRISRAGYPWMTYGENVFAYARSVFHGHAAFEVDWGTGPYGMQDPPGHRLNIHQAGFREAGIGVVWMTNAAVGPQLVTQDFATRSSAQPFITGVVYYDLNGNGFYDVGEGIGGVSVTISNHGWYGRTAVSGGYAVPVPGNGLYLVRFTGPGLDSLTQVTVTNLANVKLDFVPAYLPPSVLGPNPAAATNDNLYTSRLVGGATNYQWQINRLLPGPFVEGAEGDLSQVTLDVSPGYGPQITDRVASGIYAFHLAHPTPPRPQILQLNPVFWVRTNSQLRFASRLGWATTNQVARVQVSRDEGRTWSNLWSRGGTGGSGDVAWQTVTLALGTLAGQMVQIRFVYDYLGGTYYYQTTSDVGWLLDNIEVSAADRIGASALHDGGPEGRFVFRPPATGAYLMRVRAQLPGRVLPWGPVREVTAEVLPPISLRFVGPILVEGGRLTAWFEVLQPRSGAIYRLWRADQPQGPWAEVPEAQFEPISGQIFWQVSGPVTGVQGYYRLSVN